MKYLRSQGENRTTFTKIFGNQTKNYRMEPCKNILLLKICSFVLFKYLPSVKVQKSDLK